MIPGKRTITDVRVISTKDLLKRLEIDSKGLTEVHFTVEKGLAGGLTIVTKIETEVPE